jgi:hypothetical protein
MDPTLRTLRRWGRALEIARILFEQEGYHSRYLDEIEEALTRRRIRPEQAEFWLRLKRAEPITCAEAKRYGVEFITTPRRLREVSRRYPCPTAVDVGTGVFGGEAGLLFIDDEDGRAVAYAPPALRRGPAVHCDWCHEPTWDIGDCGYCRNCCQSRCTHKDCDCFTLESNPSERWQIRGRELARALHRLAPADDQDALILLQGTVEEGWVTEAEVGLSTRARACAAQHARKVDALTSANTH